MGVSAWVRRRRGARLVALSWSEHRSLTVMTLAYPVVAALLPTAFIFTSANLVGSVPAALRDGRGSAAAATLLTWTAVAVVVVALQQVVVPLMTTLLDHLVRRVEHRVEQEIQAAINLKSTVADLEDPATLDLVTKARGAERGWMPGGALSAGATLWTTRLSAVGAVALIATVDWRVALCLLAAPISLIRFWRERYRSTMAPLLAHASDLRRAGYTRELSLVPASGAEIRVFGLPSWMRKRHHNDWNAAMEGVWREWRRGRSQMLIASAVPGVISTLVLTWIAARVISGDASLTDLLIVAQGSGGAANLYSGSENEMRLTACLDSLDHLNELEARCAPTSEEGEASSAAERVPPRPSAPSRSIRFEGVSFTYPSRTEPVFESLDLEIEAGRSTAVVGFNGAGKTTLVKLLAGLHRPDAGRITVDGIDFGDMDPSLWQRQVGAIFQDFGRYHVSAADNVSFGAPEHGEDLEGVIATASRLGLVDVIEALPSGWHTPLWRQRKGGAELSGGQWQRLALARALFAVRHGATVLVLDEPTASLDVRAEADLYDRFLDLTAGATTILISHRFSTVRRADRIVVIDEGRVVEDGNHDELVAAGGQYASLFSLQAARFADDEVEAESGV